MSTKKRFSISADLASGIRNTIESAATNQGQLHYDMMSVADIEPDPLNPRRLVISRHEIIQGINERDPSFQHKHKEFETLTELAESIKRIGIRNAIEVYKEGSKYRIISGERRFLAAILCGLKSVPVRISPKPDDFHLRYTQWVENINREDLSLWEKFNNLTAMASAYKKTNVDDFNEKSLQSLLGVSHTQAYRYMSLLKADEKIIELVEAGKVNNIKLVQELSSMKDKGAQRQIIAWITAAKQEVTSIKSYLLAAGKQAKTTKPKASSIHIGKIKNSTIAKELFKIVGQDPRMNKYRLGVETVDWTSSKSIGKAFKQLFNAIEKEFCLQEFV